jgi:hypothetical protein
MDGDTLQSVYALGRAKDFEWIVWTVECEKNIFSGGVNQRNLNTGSYEKFVCLP